MMLTLLQAGSTPSEPTTPMMILSMMPHVAIAGPGAVARGADTPVRATSPTAIMFGRRLRAKVPSSSSNAPRIQRRLVQVRASYERETASDPLKSRQPPAYPPATMRPPPGGPPPGGPPPPPRGGGSLLRKLTTPAAIIAAALVLAVANPGYTDKGRANLLFEIYNRESGYNAVVKDDVVYKFNPRTKSVTADNKNGLQIQADGGMFVTVRMKDNPGRVKAAYYLGNIKDLPPVPKNPTQKDVEKWEALVEKKYGPVFDRLPDLKKVYEAPEPGVKNNPGFGRKPGYLKLFE